MKTCNNRECSNTFERTTQRYCSTECYTTERRRVAEDNRPHSSVRELTCKYSKCDNTFEVKNAKKFCCKKCLLASRALGEDNPDRKPIDKFFLVRGTISNVKHKGILDD